MRKTLLHELIHIVYEKTGIEHKEEDVLRAEHVLWQMMVDNPEMWEWVIKAGRQGSNS